MHVNHLIVGAKDPAESEQFYVHFLGFTCVGTFIDTGTKREGKVLVVGAEKAAELELLLVPFETVRLPNPQHLALEVDGPTFETIARKATEKGIVLRAEPALDSPARGFGTLESRGTTYRIFYLLDPARTNVEIMTRN